MDLINALPGNGSVNTVQHATIEQRGYANPFLGNGWVNTSPQMQLRLHNSA
jgi:hypothetical protein